MNSQEVGFESEAFDLRTLNPEQTVEITTISGGKYRVTRTDGMESGSFLLSVHVVVDSDAIAPGESIDDMPEGYGVSAIVCIGRRWHCVSQSTSPVASITLLNHTD